MSKLIINKNQRFGKLLVIEEVQSKRLPSGQTNRCFKCLCDCGSEKIIRLVHLSRGRTISCGCVSGINKKKTDNEIYIRKIWRAIKYRTKSNYAERHLYYDKGVVVCYEWINNYESFKIWALENNLEKGKHIDRIDSNGNYDPNNCRVVSPVINANNKCNTFVVNYKGVNKPFMLLLREKKLIKNEGAIRSRIKRGWDIDRAIDIPVKIGKYKRSLKS